MKKFVVYQLAENKKPMSLKAVDVIQLKDKPSAKLKDFTLYYKGRNQDLDNIGKISLKVRINTIFCKINFLYSTLV